MPSGSLVSVPDGIKTYPDQSSVNDAIQGDTVLGSRDQDIALIAFPLRPLRIA